MAGNDDIAARAKAEIIGPVGIIGHALTPRTGIGRNKDQAQFRTGPAKFALFSDIGMGAGQTRQIPDHRQFGTRRVGRDIDRKGHVRSRRGRMMFVDTLHTTKSGVRRNRFKCHARCPSVSR